MRAKCMPFFELYIVYLHAIYFMKAAKSYTESLNYMLECATPCTCQCSHIYANRNVHLLAIEINILHISAERSTHAHSCSMHADD